MEKTKIEIILRSHLEWIHDSEKGSKADLGRADLRGADLREAKIQNCIGNCREIKTIQTEKWNIVYTDSMMSIGCELHCIEDWFGFDADRIIRMDSESFEFWKKWKPILW